MAAGEEPSTPAFIPLGSEMGRLIASFDWGLTSVGAIATWPSSLKTTVALMLGALAQIVLFWGPEFIALYNDAYAPTIGDKHPRALGRPAAENWAELWDDLGPLLRGVRSTRETFAAKDRPFYIERRGYGETVYFDVSYSPVPEADGSVGGVLCIVSETTGRVLSEQRHSFRLLLEERFRSLNHPRAAMDAAVEELGRYLGAIRVGYSEVRADGDTVDCRSCYADGVAPILGTFRLDDFGRDSVDRQRAGATEVVTDIRSDPAQVQETWAALSTRAFVSVPLVRDGRLSASLYVNRREPHVWSPEEVALIEEVAARTWAAVEQAKAETALGESEERLRLATEHAEVGFWDVDMVDGVLIWPPRVKAMFGISAEVPVSMADFYAGLHPDDRAATSAAFAAATDPRTRGVYDVEYRTVGKEDAIVRWVAAKGRGIFDETGRCVRVIGTAIDITNRKAIEQQLRELNETLESRVRERTAERNRVWSMSRDLFAIMGFDGYLKAINPAWEATLGYGEATLLQRPFPEQVHPDDHAAAREVIERLRRGEAVDRFEDRLRHADGSWRWIAWGLVPEGDVFYAVGRDVTAEKEAAAELERAQEALRQSQKMEAMGQLTGGVAHDFNNLLTPIVGALDMLQRKGLGGEREQRLIAGAMQSAERAKTLVQRLLAFARRQPLQPTAVDVAKLVGGMAELVESTTGPQIKVAVEVADDLPPAKADPNQIEMALLNLSVNARDAMPDGGTLRISASAVEVPAGAREGRDLRPGRYVRLSVADTGVGMDEATLARAVEPFFSTKGVGKGTGLGLSMVHGLASQLGGALTIRSRPGLGTNVELWLPQADERLEVQQATPSREAAWGRGMALLVDDEEFVRLSTADMLAELGYDVLEAASAEEAIGLVRNGAVIDLVVTDHLMPGMTGSELARAVKAVRPRVPILVVSGYAEGEGIEPDLPRLSKPFRKDELAACLADLTRADGAQV